MKPPAFLTPAEVLAVHQDQIERYGGDARMRDRGLFEAAVAVARAGFGGKPLHRSLFDMAAAYAYHLAQNQPFVDGNKRTALAAALLFLELNGVSVIDPKGELGTAMFDMAAGRLGKPGLARLFRRLSS